MKNPFNVWNKSPSSSERSLDARHAANRILDGYYSPEMLPADFVLEPGASVFTMGSCFARELEWALRKHGYDISSMPAEVLALPAFQDAAGKPSAGFFHRYNVPSMELEFRRAVGDIEFDEASDLLVEASAGRFQDLNYGQTLARGDLALVLERRELARRMVAGFTRARLIVVTLGLAEAWFHKPSGMHCNGVTGDLLVRNRDDFEFRFVGFQENLDALSRLAECISRHHETGDYQLVVTISPVPLTQTFSGSDIVVANARAKATLRAVAAEFCDSHPRSTYFPSYEIAMFSNPEMVWRPDRVHIQPECVKHIVGTFIEKYTARSR